MKVLDPKSCNDSQESIFFQRWKYFNLCLHPLFFNKQEKTKQVPEYPRYAIRVGKRKHRLDCCMINYLDNCISHALVSFVIVDAKNEEIETYLI